MDLITWRRDGASDGYFCLTLSTGEDVAPKQDSMNYVFLVDASGSMADSGKLPQKPTITYIGPANYPIDSLTFQASEFADPQGVGTFDAMQWRVAEVTKLPKAAGSIPLTDPIWKSEPVRMEVQQANSLEPARRMTMWSTQISKK